MDDGIARTALDPEAGERFVSLRRQTHGDWVHASMVRYRARLRALPCPS